MALTVCVVTLFADDVMKRIVAMALLAALPGVSGAAEFPLKRVVLSTSGLAQFTHSGGVTAATVVELPVRLDQVDDVLKSLTVFDSAGAIGAVSLPGKTPLVEIFRDLPFSQQALESQSALLERACGRRGRDRRQCERGGPRLPHRGRAGSAAQ